MGPAMAMVAMSRITVVMIDLFIQIVLMGAKIRKKDENSKKTEKKKNEGKRKGGGKTPKAQN
jgi:preprotein translocase subunit SecG